MLTAKSWLLALIVSQYAAYEQDMNAAERVIAFTELPREGTATRTRELPRAWPEKGSVEFKDVRLAYREGLPLVLKGVSFAVKPGEKVCFIFCFSYRRFTYPRIGRDRGPYRFGKEHLATGSLQNG